MSKLPEQCILVRNLIYEKLCDAIDKLPQNMVIELFDNYNEKYADEIAKYKRKEDSAYNAIIRYIVAYLEYGCRQYAMKRCAESSTLPDCSSNNTLFIKHFSDGVYKINDLLEDETGELVIRILRDELKLDQIASIDTAQLCPSIMRKEKEEAELRRTQKITQRVSHAYVCRKCNSRSTITHEKQTRCSDEAPTIFIQCTECAQKWSING